MKKVYPDAKSALAGLLRDDPDRMRSDVRSAISEIRSIVRGANESNRSLANLIALQNIYGANAHVMAVAQSMMQTLMQAQR